MQEPYFSVGWRYIFCFTGKNAAVYNGVWTACGEDEKEMLFQKGDDKMKVTREYFETHSSRFSFT